MSRGSMERAARDRIGLLRWWVVATGLLFVTVWSGLLPSPITAFVPAFSADAAALLGLFGGTVLAGWLLRRGQVDGDGVGSDVDSGLATRDQADAVASCLIERDTREGNSRLALVLVELEAGAEIRRRYGAPAVAALLRMVGETLTSQCRSADLPFRFTDHALAVYLHCADLDQASAFGRRLQMLLASQQLDWRGDVLKPTVEMTVAMHRPGQGLVALQAAVVAADGTAQGGR